MDIYNFNKETKEFISKTVATESPLEKGVFLIPANATIIKPLDTKENFAVCFNEDKQEWEYIEDNRNKTVYNKETKEESKIDYLGKIKDDVTTLKPGRFDIWEVDKWVEDIEAKNKYELQIKINEAKQYLSKTDHKFYNGYKPKVDEDLVEIERLRDEAREFIRNNK